MRASRAKSRPKATERDTGTRMSTNSRLGTARSPVAATAAADTASTP
jgi:hypothetical protein